MGELKQLKVSSLRSLIVAFGIERSFVKPYWRIHQVLNNSKRTKNKKHIGLKLENDLEL
jgi:hypothetical protein